MKNLTFLFEVAVSMFSLFSTIAMAGTPYYDVQVTAKGGKTLIYADVGEEITFEISENYPDGGGRLTRNDFVLDCNTIKWTNLGVKEISHKMAEQGISISTTVVKKLLKKHNFKKRKAVKNETIGWHLSFLGLHFYFMKN
jgi:hypothetical protein